MEIKNNKIVATPRSKYHKYLFGGSSSGSSSSGSISIDTNNFVKKTGETSQTVEGDFISNGAIVAKYMAESYVPDFPIATANLLGLIKIGANLSIDSNGVLSATGGGSGVSSFNDLTDKPTTLSGYGISAADTLFDSKYAPTNHTHSQYLTSYINNYLTGVSGSGNGTITFTRNGLTDLTFNAAHTHSYLALTGGTLTGSLTATSFIKSSGTSSQFLKADGSVDSSSYITGISSFVQNNLTYSTSNTTQALSAYQGYLLNRNDITAASLTASTLTLTRASGNLTATVPTWNQSTTGNAATATNADKLDGYDSTSFVMASDVLYSSTGNYATYANKIPKLDATLGALEIGQFIDFHGTTTSVDYTHRLISYGDGFQIKAPSGSYSYIFDNTGKFTSPGAIVAKYSSASYATDWPIMTASLQGTAIAGSSLIMTGNTVNIRNRHYTTTSTYTDNKTREITAEVPIGTGTIANSESISITLSFLPISISYGVVGNILANASTWAGVGMKISFVKGGTYWMAFITNDLGTTITKDGIYLSISAKQTV